MSSVIPESLTVDLFGLKNCDSCRRALRFFADRGVPCMLRDIRSAPHTAAALDLVREHEDWASFVNRRSTTWRTLTPADRDGLDRTRALRLLGRHPTLIKRPVLVIGATVLVGFDATRVMDLLG